VLTAGADAVLVGEALMRQDDVTSALETLIQG
jgi:indole-3-glycerol phosphate synthase